jgi:glutamate-5-semialdehyde dehydrogenase
MMRLEVLTPGMPIVYGGDKVVHVDEALAAQFKPGDRLLVVDGALLHVPAGVQTVADDAVGRAHAAFAAMAGVTDDQITGFFDAFARNLESEAAWTPIAEANAADVREAQRRGRSTTRLLATPKMRADMVAGLREWRDTSGGRERLVERVEHDGWSVEQVTAPLGVVGFVFEGRPNVFADAAGVIRTGNTVVFRIGSDALGTARAIQSHALAPALAEAGLPAGAAVLVDSAERSAGWALFSDPRLSLAVARGSGPAVAQLGGVARQSGVPVSLHGTGGAWLVADETADTERFAAVVRTSLDRKVCNTLNVCCIVRSRAGELVPRFLEALAQAGDVRGHGCKLHVADGDFDWLPDDWRKGRTRVRRADGDHDEPLAQPLRLEDLAVEWEWEETPEVSLKIVESLDEAIALFNRFSPQFVGSLVSEDPAAHARFWAGANAGFVGDGFTRWVDGQYALNRPELGLSNWQFGRLFARGEMLSGDGVYTIRTRMRQASLDVKR